MFIVGAGTLRYRDIIDVIDAAKGAGVEKVGIVTEGMRKAAGVARQLELHARPGGRAARIAQRDVGPAKTCAPGSTRPPEMSGGLFYVRALRLAAGGFLLPRRRRRPCAL